MPRVQLRRHPRRAVRIVRAKVVLDVAASTSEAKGNKAKADPHEVDAYLSFRYFLTRSGARASTSGAGMRRYNERQPEGTS